MIYLAGIVLWVYFGGSGTGSANNSLLSYFIFRSVRASCKPKRHEEVFHNHRDYLYVCPVRPGAGLLKTWICNLGLGHLSLVLCRCCFLPRVTDHFVLGLFPRKRCGWYVIFSVCVFRVVRVEIGRAHV